MTASELRSKYLAFFASKGHSAFPSGSLIPYDVTGRLDESLLFNGAGMVQFKPYFRGTAEPANRRLVTAQKCVRTGDIESVGDLSHLTFFEMMGNFSFGDYFKKEAIAYSWEFLTSTEWLGLDPKRLSFTVFEEDDEAYGYWAEHIASVGIDPATRIFRLGEETNYWPAGAFSGGPPGPCGPNSEMFFWTSNDVPPPTGAYTREDYLRDEAKGLWLEIWNDVFIQFEWQGEPADPSRPDAGWKKTGMPNLPFQSIDTGMGLERTTAVLNGLNSVYDTDVFRAILAKLEAINQSYVSHPNYQAWTYGSDADKDRAARIIADHIRTACFCIADGVLPGNTGRGYVLRRLIRRAVLKGQRALGFHEPFFHLVYEGVAAAMGDHYHELYDRRDVIVETLRNEEAMFRRTLDLGEARLLAEIQRLYTDYLWPLRREVFLPVEKNTDFVDPEWSSVFTRSAFESDSQIPTASFVSDVAKLIDSFEWAGKLRRQAIFLRGYGEGRESGLPVNERGEIPLFTPESEAAINDLTLVPGEAAFMLYDTFGFPIEVTQELCEEMGFEIDLEGYERAMKEAQERSRAGSGMDTVYGGVEIQFIFVTEDGKTEPTEFLGYQATESPATIIGAMPAPSQPGEPTEIAIALDQTPFYAESGGQVSDMGHMEGNGFRFEVVDLIKQDGVYVHLVRGAAGADALGQLGLSPDATPEMLNKALFKQPVTARVDAPRRRAITRNHTATHLMHAALRAVLGKHVTQAGSLVAPDHLRFDFTHGKAMSPSEIAEVERLVTENILAAQGVVTYADVPLDDARAMGAMALFGEKYADFVRVVQIGEMPPSEASFSRELCGGIHTRNTGEIGLFKILHESSAASGVRRITAVTGEGALDWLNQQMATLHEAADKLKSTPQNLVHAIEKLTEQLRDERKKLEKLRTQAASSSEAATQMVGAIELVVQTLPDADAKEAALIADRLSDGKPGRVVVVAAVHEGKPTLVAKAGPDAVKNGAHAGNLVKALAQKLGGGGGGRPDFATAGGKTADGLEAALAEIPNLLG